MQHTKTPNTSLAALRTQRSTIVTRMLADRRITDELTPHRNRMNQNDLDRVNAQIAKRREAK
ncbi:MAG: hypothetical protein ACYTGS_18460 [Planctomycetota bacterium]|jgi:hypothetical protein